MSPQEQHTPQPWRYVENRNTPRVESEATGQRICNFFGGGGLYASYRANACIIVAAPAMLKALEHREHCECCIEDVHACTRFQQLRRTALAQARPSAAVQIPEAGA